MTNIVYEKSPNLTARMAGFVYLLMTPLAVFSIIYIPSNLFVQNDIAQTIANIEANEILLRLAIVGAFVTQLVTIYLVYLLYRILRPVSEIIAISMVIFIIIGVPIAMINELNYVAILLNINEADMSPTAISMFLNLHIYGINLSGFFWGLWLFSMGYLVIKSTYIPKIIGILLIAGGFGYLADSVIFFLNPDFPFEFAPFLFIGEISMAFWLLIMGVNEDRFSQISAS